MDAATKPMLIPSRTHYREAQADSEAAQSEAQENVAGGGVGAPSEALLLRN